MTTVEATATALRHLRERLHGRLHLPGDAGWDEARSAWQVLCDQHPRAVVEASDVHDVVEAVRAARALGLALAPQSTGHAAGTLPPLDDAILLRTSRLDGVSVDPAARTARVGAGALWADVAAAAAEHGLAPVSGMAPGVGATGFLLGGGLGWLARSHGLGAAGILSLDIVDAKARILHVDDESHPELLWAARGGVLPAIVTAVTIRLHRVGQLTAGSLMWPVGRTAEISSAWQRWTRELPSSVTSLVRVLRLPPAPEVPEPLRGQSFVVVEAAIQGNADAAQRLLEPLRALLPLHDVFRPMTPAELGEVHGDPPSPMPALGDSLLVAEISPATVAAFADAVSDPTASSLVSVEMRHTGGAPSGPAGAVTRLDADGLLYAVGVVAAPEELESVRGAVDALMQRLRPFASPRRAKTFTEHRVDAELLYGEAVERLGEIVRKWDEDAVLRLGHPLDR